jgi:hypothetical protein
VRAREIKRSLVCPLSSPAFWKRRPSGSIFRFELRSDWVQARYSCLPRAACARHTVEMRLDRDGHSIATSSGHDSECLLYIILPLLLSIIPVSWVGSRSYYVQEESSTLSRPWTSGKNAHARLTATHMYLTRLMSDELDSDKRRLSCSPIGSRGS